MLGFKRRYFPLDTAASTVRHTLGSRKLATHTQHGCPQVQQERLIQHAHQTFLQDTLLSIVVKPALKNTAVQSGPRTESKTMSSSGSLNLSFKGFLSDCKVIFGWGPCLESALSAAPFQADDPD